MNFLELSKFCPLIDNEVMKRLGRCAFEPVTRGATEEFGLATLGRWIAQNQDRIALGERSVRLWRELEGQGALRLLTYFDEDYPSRLRNWGYGPPLLFSRGNISVLNRQPVAVVGARNPTSLGRYWVQSFVPQFVRASRCTILSGGARGIDTEAHRGALQAPGPTVVFLPTCVDAAYPATNQLLFEEVVAQGGALISDFPPGTPVRKENFQRRNKILSVCSSAVVIVEAGIKSGTLMTAKKALDENVDVFVVPGPPMIPSYMGSLELIVQHGTPIVRDHHDLLELLSGQLELL